MSDPTGEDAMGTLAALAVAAALSLLPAAARAQPVSAPSGPDTVLQLHGGAFVPQHQINGFDVGYDFGLLFGVRFERHVSVEGGVAFYRVILDESAPGAWTHSTLRAVPLTASVRLRQPFEHAEISALAGVGLHFARLSTHRTFVTLPETTESESAASTSFGFHVGAGAAFDVWPTTLVGIEVVRTFVPGHFDTGERRIDGLRADLTLNYRL